MPEKNRPYDEPNPNEDAGRKRQRLAAPSAGFDSLPPEMLADIARGVANQQDRLQADTELTTLRLVNKRINNSILQYRDMREGARTLRRHPGVRSRHLAVCLDVVSGVQVEEAIAQNRPLPKQRDLTATDVRDALTHATPEHLATLAQAFGDQTDPASKEVLTGVGLAASQHPGIRGSWLNSASLDRLSALVRALNETGVDVEDPDIRAVNEAVAIEVARRGDVQLAQANIDHITTLGNAFAGHDDRNFQNPTNYNDAMVALSHQVATRADDLLPQASADQLETLRTIFEIEQMADCRNALAQVASETARRDAAAQVPNNNSGRPQLDNRNRSGAVEL